MKHTHAASGTRRYMTYALVCLLLLTSVFFIITSHQRSETKARAGETLSFLESTCQNYDNYQLGVSTKDLQALINKAVILTMFSHSYDLTDEAVLSRYAHDQYLTGVAVLDNDLHVSGIADILGGDSDAVIDEILARSNPASIVLRPEKTFAGHMKLNGRSYDFAVASLRSGDGLVICYSDVTMFQSDKYELSLSTFFDAPAFSSEAVIVVTDGETVLSSSVAGLQGIPVSECPITDIRNEDRYKSDSELIELKDGGSTWYGCHALSHGYYLYVFFPSFVVFDGRTGWLLSVGGLCIILCLVIELRIQRSKKEKLLQMEKEYHLTSAISSIYCMNIIMRLDEHSWEAVILPPDIEADVLGIPDADEMLRTLCQRHVSPAYHESFLEYADLGTVEKRMSGKPFLGFTFEDEDGVWFQSLLIPQQDSGGELTTVILLLRNVSDQKRSEMEYQERLRKSSEAAEYANHAKTDFLRRMSHDIRTPINGIRGMADIGLSNSGSEVKVRECFEKILSSSDFLLDLVNNVLDMSKLENGEAALDSRAFDIDELLRDSYLIIESQARASGLRFIQNPSVIEHRQLIGSPLHIRQILHNIMSNAVKYNRPGGSITVSCRETGFDGEYSDIEFTCADTGIGMSESFAAHAFDTFAQESDSARTKYSGTGLGLSIAKQTAEMMGGSVSFTTKEGVGSTFKVRLRLPVSHVSHDTEKPAADISLCGIRVLLAEDNDLNREIAEYMLSSRGADVKSAQNGLAALELFRLSPPGYYNIVLLDVMMPEMDGFETARAIRQLPRPDCDVPIFAVSANAFADDIASSKASGMNEHFSKPLDFDALAAAISRYCRK